MKYVKATRFFALLMCSIFLAACSTTTPTSTNASVSMEDSDSTSTQDAVAESPSKTEEGGETSREDLLNLGDFEAEVLDGDNITQDIFSDYDLTVINVWATWCPPCIEEMPDLQILNESLPENVNFLTICDDGLQQEELARSIVTESNGTYPVLLANDQMDENIMSRIQAFPTTLFVDSEGYVLTALPGVPGDDPAAAYLSMVDSVLEQL